MTIAQLIEILQRFEPDAKVYIKTDFFFGDFEELTVEFIKIKDNNIYIG